MAVHFSVLPLSDVLVTIGPLKRALAVHFAVLPLPNVLATFGQIVSSLAMKTAVLPLPDVLVAIGPLQSALAVHFAAHELSFAFPIWFAVLKPSNNSGTVCQTPRAISRIFEAFIRYWTGIPHSTATLLVYHPTWGRRSGLVERG